MNSDHRQYPRCHGRRHPRLRLQRGGHVEKGEAVEMETEVVKAEAKVVQQMTNCRSASARRIAT